MVSKPTITLPDATIIGAHQPPSPSCPKPVHTFKRIPYAKAPRFKSPTLLPPSGTIDASTPHSAVFPNPMMVAKTDIPEDVLTLNVIRPAVAPTSSGEEEKKRLLPVVIYLHGGGFNFGSPADADARDWVGGCERDVVVVAVAYRLGVLGFGPGQEGNLGLRDQRVAREWVDSYIGGFGGDREDVTMLGVSAGGHSAGHHILNPQPSLPLPKKVILESASPTARSVLSPTHPRIQRQSAAFNNLLPSAASATLDKVLDASIKVWGQEMHALTWPFQPTVQEPLSDLPLKSWQTALAAQEESVLPDVLTGFCRTEGRSFIQASHLPFRKFWQAFIPGLPLDELETLYPSADFSTEVERLYISYGDYAYKCPVIHTAHMVSKKGKKAFVYEYAGEDGKGKTTGHCAHAPVVRGATPRQPGLAQVSGAMKKRWERFVVDGGGEMGEEWPVFHTPFTGTTSTSSSSGGEDGTGEEKRGELLVFGEGNNEAAGGREGGVPVKTRVLTSREREVSVFWWRVMELSEGMGTKGVVSEPY